MIVRVLKSLLVASLLVGCAATRTPLNDAIVAGDLPGVQALLDGGASIEAYGLCGEGEQRPFYCALDRDRPDILRLLVDRLPAAARQEKLGEMLRFVAGWRKPASVRLFLDLGADVDAKDIHGNTALSLAAYQQKVENAKLLLARGADIDVAIAKGEADAAAASSARSREKERAGVRLLQEMKGKVLACTVRYRPDAALVAGFPKTVATYRGSPKPALSEDVRMYRLQAEDAVAGKRFQQAVELYGKALSVAPWWPEGHFNQALILGESGCVEPAVAAMERYLALVPDAPDARAARDQIHVWKGRMP